MTDITVISYEADDSVNINGTSYQGELTATYSELCEVFGKPTYTDADPYEKVNAEWSVDVVIEDPWPVWDETETCNEVFTIYNWKTEGIPTEKYKWHIGGRNGSGVVVEIANTIFKNNLSS